MTDFVIHASVAIKWIVQEQRTSEALALRKRKLCAPDLIVAECANILWKKVRLKELTAGEASAAAQLLARADVELLPMREHFQTATDLAIELDHPAYDCVYLAVALAKGCAFVTADDRLLRRVRQGARSELADALISMSDAAALP
jgi:predicted nucleic acid-binding protein